MSSQTDFNDFPFSNLVVCSVKNDENLEDVLSKLLSWQQEESCILGFDRSLWAKLSSGFVPPQLYSLEFGDASFEKCFFLAAQNLSEKLSELEGLVTVRLQQGCDTAELNGELRAASFVEEEFVDGRYLACLNSTKTLAEVAGARKLTVERQQLYLTEEIYELDDMVSQSLKDILSGNYFYIPSLEKLRELPELLNDIEKIHLGENITGIRC